MPVMYRRDMGRQWLEQSISGELELLLVTQPVLSEELTRFRRFLIHPRMTRRNAFGGSKANHKEPINCFLKKRAQVEFLPSFLAFVVFKRVRACRFAAA